MAKGAKGPKTGPNVQCMNMYSSGGAARASHVQSIYTVLSSPAVQGAGWSEVTLQSSPLSPLLFSSKTSTGRSQQTVPWSRPLFSTSGDASKSKMARRCRSAGAAVQRQLSAFLAGPRVGANHAWDGHLETWTDLGKSGTASLLAGLAQERPAPTLPAPRRCARCELLLIARMARRRSAQSCLAERCRPVAACTGIVDSTVRAWAARNLGRWVAQQVPNCQSDAQWAPSTTGKRD